MSYYNCLVCGYEKMLRPPSNGYICPCCGTEYEFDDDELSHEELCERWVANGMRWFSDNTLPPAGWNPVLQLKRAGLWLEKYTALVQQWQNWQRARARNLVVSFGVSGEQGGRFKSDLSLIQNRPMRESELQAFSARAAA